MSARKARGNAATGAPAPALRAAALMAAPCEIQRSVTQPAPSGQASACKPNQPAPAPRQAFKATAPQGFEPRPAGAECVPNEAAPSGRIIDASIPLALFSGAALGAAADALVSQAFTANEGSLQSIRGIKGIDTVMLQNLEAVLRMQAPPPPPQAGGGGGGVRAAAELLTMENDEPPDPEVESDGREELTELGLEGS